MTAGGTSETPMNEYGAQILLTAPRSRFAYEELVAMCPLKRAVLVTPTASRNGAPGVFALGNWFKVFWVHAFPMQAQVIQHHPFGDGTDVQFVDRSVGNAIDALASCGGSAPCSDMAIAITAKFSLPAPASVWITTYQPAQALFQGQGLRPRRATTKAPANGASVIGYGKMFLHRESLLSGVMGPGASTSRSPSILSGLSA